MDVKRFIKSIYLGDRCCRKVLLNGLENLISVEVDVISRIRSDTGMWDYYTAEDIVNGLIVFFGVKSFELSPPGFLPNDQINYLTVKEDFRASGSSRNMFEISIDAADEHGTHQEVVLNIIADGIYLENPVRPGVKIAE